MLGTRGRATWSARLTVDFNDLLHGPDGVGIGPLLQNLLWEGIELEERSKRALSTGGASVAPCLSRAVFPVGVFPERTGHEKENA